MATKTLLNYTPVLPCRLRRFLLACAVFVLLAAAACSQPRPAVAPLRTIEVKPAVRGSRSLVVLLPGRRDRPEDFLRHGFGELAIRRNVAARIIAVDAHPGYYLSRTIVTRLREDVIAPARAAGADRIWLAGVSLGGTGSILYSIEHPEDVSGIALFAPFLGDDEMRREIEAAGGLRGWTPPQPLEPTDFQRRLWAWLERYKDGSDGRMPVYLGWGRSDRFARIDGLLGAVLPPERVFTAPGGHGWKAWRALWERFLESGALREADAS